MLPDQWYAEQRCDHAFGRGVGDDPSPWPRPRFFLPAGLTTGTNVARSPLPRDDRSANPAERSTTARDGGPSPSSRAVAPLEELSQSGGPRTGS